MALRREIKLLSPVGAEPAVFPWPLTSFDGREGFEELRITFNFVCEDIPELRMPCQNILSEVDSSSFDNVKDSCERFNRAVVSIQRMWKGTSCSKKYLERHRPSNPLLKHILMQCYYRAVVEPEKLNQYEPFSPEVYGETSFELVDRMVSQIKWPDNSVFVDLGSGVAQVVLQVAAAVPQLKMAFGVERADLPSAYAKAMDAQFRFWMNWYGKSYSDYQIVKDDFLSKRWEDVISDADVVFANNFAFGPQVNHELKQRIQHMKEGSKIVCSLSLCPMKFEITERNLSDVAAILRVEELSITPNTQAVSWTGRDFSFYLHTVDRTMLEHYFERKVRRERAGNGNGSGSSHSSASSVSNDDSMGSGKSNSSGGVGGGGKSAAGNNNNNHSHHHHQAHGGDASFVAANGQNGETGGQQLVVIGGESSTTRTGGGEEPPVVSKKKSKQHVVENGGSSSSTSQVVHRGRGRPAKIPRLSSSSTVVTAVTLKKSSSIKSTLKGAEELLLRDDSSKKRKREKGLEAAAGSEQAGESKPKSLKTSIKIPTELYHNRQNQAPHPVPVPPQTPDLSTREGRIDALLAKIKGKMAAFLEVQGQASQKARIEERLETARKKNAELRDRERALVEELSQLASSNNARLRQQVDSLASLSLAEKAAATPAPGPMTVQTLAEFVAESKRIVKRNVNLRDLINNSNSSSSSTQMAPPPAPPLPQSSQSSSSYPLAPFQTISTPPPPQPQQQQQQQQRFTEQQQQQAVSIFNSTLAALLPSFYSATQQQQNSSSISAGGGNPHQQQQGLMSQFLGAPSQNQTTADLMRQFQGGPPPWFQIAPQQPSMLVMAAPSQQQVNQPQASPQASTTGGGGTPGPPGPPPTTTTTSCGHTPVSASVEEALKAIMATAVNTSDRSASSSNKNKGRRSGTPQISTGGGDSLGGTATPDTAKKTPQRRTPQSKPRKQQQQQQGGGGGGGTPEQLLLGAGPGSGSGIGIGSSAVSPPLHVVTNSSDMAEFLSHMRLPEPHPRPPSAAPVVVVTSTSQSKPPPPPPPSGPVFHISSMVFRPSSANTTTTTATMTTNVGGGGGATGPEVPAPSESVNIQPEVQPSQA